MEYRQFGNTALQVSEVGFGAWAIGGGAMVGNTAIGWGGSDDGVSARAIKTALDRGINFFDTADIYGLGHSEKLLGQELGNRQDVVMSTKAGNVARDGQFTVDYSKKYIVAACEASLKRLKRDAIDYYQLHTARLAHLQQGECIEAMQLLQQQGKIRYWGLSLNTFNPLPEAEYMIQNGLGNGFQLVLNMINQRALPVLQKAAEQGYGVIARMPLQFGLLTGKFDAGVAFEENDHRKNRLTPKIVAASAEATAPVWALCQKYNCTKTQLAMSYVLAYNQVSTVIPGIRTAAQAVDNTTGLVQLSGEDKAMIESLSGLPGLLQLIEQQG
jgi:aryl-alcohol dehydrogenase-like predicted oxidoreductase